MALAQPRPVFEEVELGPSSVRLRGRSAVARIEAPRPGVLRIRVAPRAIVTSRMYPDLVARTSFARVADDAALPPLRARRLAAAADLLVEAGGVSLHVSLADGGWRFGDAGGELARALGYEGEASAGFPVDRARSRVALVAPPGAAYLGFGEKVGPLDKRGMRFTFWNTDAFPPQPHTDPLYASIPFFVSLEASGRAWGLFVDETTRSHVDVASEDPDRIVWDVEGPEIDAYLLAGPAPADVLRRYVELTGRPFVPPLFALGAQQSRWGYASAREVKDVVRNLRAHGIPLDVLMLDIDHMDAFKVFTWDRTRFGDPRTLSRELAAEGVRIVPIVDPALKAEPGYAPYEEARDSGYLVELERGGPLVGEVWPDPAVFPDLTRPEVRRFWGDLHRGLVDAGMAGVWNDMNEPACFSIETSRGVPAPSGVRLPGATAPVGSTLPDEARHGELRHLEAHNAYALGMAEAAYDGLARHAPSRRPFVLTRAAYAGIQRHAALWTGDFGSHWSHLEASLPMLLGLGLSGVPFVGADVPGFLGDASGELLVRWTQAAIFAPLFRNHSARGTRRQEPWRFGEPWLSHARRAYELRYRLLPALYTAIVAAHGSGLPPLAPLVLAHPGDREALVACDELLFAGALLVAPVVRPGHTKRMVYLPRGRWVPLGFDLASAPAIDGGRHVIADAPIDRAPMFLAEGTGLAVTDPALHTTSAEWPRLDWHLHPAGPADGVGDGKLEASLYEDSGDGPAAAGATGRWTRVAGEWSDDGRLRLTRTTTGPAHARRSRERVLLHGVPDRTVAVQGANAQARQDGALVLDVEAGWTSLDVQF